MALEGLTGHLNGFPGKGREFERKNQTKEERVMAISDEDKLYCVNNLIVMILNDLYELNPGIEPEVIKQKFIGLHTYELLYNFKTHLWAEILGTCLRKSVTSNQR